MYYLAFVRMFLYNMIGVYWLLVSGSLFNALAKAIAKPSSIIMLAGAALPSTSVFFMNLMLSQLLVGVPLQLLRPGPFLIVNVFKNIFNQDKLSIREVLEGPLCDTALDYGQSIPGILFIVVVAFVFATIAPILFAIAALYFCACYVVYKYQCLYVNVRHFESGGKYFYHMYNYTNTALLASTITILIYMGVKEGTSQACLLFPLPFVVYFVWGRTEAKYKKLSENYSLSMSSNKESDAGRAADVVVSGFSEDFYLQPCLSDTGKDAVPYRIDNIPLFDKHGHLNMVYSDYSLIRASGDKSASYAAIPIDESPMEENPSSSTIAYGTFGHE